jgi:hypothetical protein
MRSYTNAYWRKIVNIAKQWGYERRIVKCVPARRLTVNEKKMPVEIISDYW